MSNWRQKNTDSQQQPADEKTPSTIEKDSELEYTLLGTPWNSSSDEMDSGSDTAIVSANESIKRLEQYNYFDEYQIRKFMNISQNLQMKGRKLCREGRIRIENVQAGYSRFDHEIVVQIYGIGNAGSRADTEFPMILIFSKKNLQHMECRCPQCRRNYNGWYSQKISCDYLAGLANLSLEYLQNHNVVDSTDVRGQNVLMAFQEKRTNTILADTTGKEESLSLVPRLMLKDEELEVSFKIGSKKMFVVKKLDEFCENVKNSATAMYGTTGEINHQLSNFTEKAKKWIRFINRIVGEETQFAQRMAESRYYYGHKKESVGSSLELFGWRLDQFFECLGEDSIEFEDKRYSSSGGKTKVMLKCAVGNPKVRMQIAGQTLEKDGKFHGIQVTGTIPEMYHGVDTAYFINGAQLCKVDKEFMEKIQPLVDGAHGNTFSFQVGRNHMAEFYYHVLPQLKDVVEISEVNSNKFRTYLPPEVYFIFYLDAEDQNVTCRARARYGNQEVSVLDNLDDYRSDEMEPFRDVGREQEVLYLLMKWLPGVDLERDELHCAGQEEKIYRLAEQGVEALLELGEVRCTNRFRNMRVVKRMKVSVGVSVSSGLLNLNLSTDNIPQEELLDILRSYQAKKKYHRLKNGEFVNLEDDSVAMVSELMDSMRISPKEFVKGKMHLPMYRTLYLDRMLEENESVYSSRDSHFREMVKGFKTVNDADFEEPESLSKIMRKYQKNGFKWLRTLEAWKFGGILADDMGLGKTLQVIAVLLAAKEEAERAADKEVEVKAESSENAESSEKAAAGSGTSLVVAPASLVFNWGEEFARFAPELKVSLITGTQEERRRKIENWQDADVLVTSYDLLKRDIDQYEDKRFSYQIIDEAQYIKNHTTAAAKAVKVIHSDTRFALTGTPIENRLSELWSIFDYLMPGFLYGYDTFKKELETPIVKNGDEEAMKRLQKMTGPFILRRLKEQVLKDLPEKLEEVRYVKFESNQQKLYDGQVVHMKQMIAKQNDAEFNKNKLQILAELTKLRQICCDPSLCFENYRGTAAKVEACMDLIESALDGGHRMLLFSQFTSMLAILQERLKKAGIPYYLITGETPKQKRLQLVKEFNEGDVPVFLISLKAGGVGLNLTGADMVIHYDPWWNQAAQNQATDRAHRIGQTKKVTVYKMIMKDSIEEKIQKLQETKRDLAEQVIGGETGQISGMTKEDFLELL